MQLYFCRLFRHMLTHVPASVLSDLPPGGDTAWCPHCPGPIQATQVINVSDPDPEFLIFSDFCHLLFNSKMIFLNNMIRIKQPTFLLSKGRKT